jgi:predicted  nucleic acid-binding Zn-ribbon protein
MATKATNKGNKNTEVIVGSAAIKLESAVKSILGAAQEVSNLDNRAAECTLKVSDLEDKIGSLESELKNQKAQNKFELDLQFKADKKSFVDVWMNENNMVYLPSIDLEDLKTKLSEATQEVNQTVSKAVNAATGALNKSHESDLKIRGLEYTTKEATNIATIDQLRSEVAIWKQQAEQWQKALDSERAARIETSKNSTVSQTFTGGGK